MDMPERFELEGGRAVFRPTGVVSFDQAVKLISAAIEAARDKGARDLLVDTTALTGFVAPDTFARFFAVVEWAARASSQLRMALVARAELIDRQKFGVTVAANRGLTSGIFTSETQAIAWLDTLCEAET